MNYIQALILGIVQGLTEFLPISSSGHLALVQHLFQLDSSLLTFDILLHLATLGAVIIFFRHKLLHLDKQYLSYLIIGSIPAFIFGFIIHSFMDTFFSTLIFPALGFIITGILLLSTKKINYTENSQTITNSSSLKIGIAQALAILPGISRSGSTVTTGLHLGVKQSEAFSFAFILSIPAILGALLLEVLSLDGVFSLTSTYALGMIAAFATGLASLSLLRYITSRSRLYVFGYYCLVLGVVTLIYYFSQL
jgi:undecaprenyl-diphosphatase